MYKIIKNTKTCIQIAQTTLDFERYPDFEDLTNLKYMNTAEWEHVGQKDLEGMHILLACIIRALPKIKNYNSSTGFCDQSINFNMVEDLLSLGYTFDCYVNKIEAQPIIFESGLKKAFIMPLSYNND